MWNDFLFSIWFFLPAGFANVAPILATKIPILKDWNTPLDFGKTYRNRQIFGSNKTWRGLVCAVLIAQLTFLAERHLAPQSGQFALLMQELHYTTVSVWLGVLLGFGEIMGDAVESFIKRQQAIDPGASWFPYDQLDYIIGGCLAAAVVIVLPANIYIWILFSWFFLHILFSYIGYLLHFKSRPI